ncbi:hypothetical protein D3C74_424150 [compost metagenome]
MPGVDLADDLFEDVHVLGRVGIQAVEHHSFFFAGEQGFVIGEAFEQFFALRFDDAFASVAHGRLGAGDQAQRFEANAGDVRRRDMDVLDAWHP